MSHDSRRELYEIFRLNYTKLNIILKKDGAYNGEKCPRRRANNSQQPTSNNTAGTNDRPNVTRTNLQRTNIEIARPIRKRTRCERNATAGNERVAVNKIHVACQWESSAHGYVWVLGWLRVTGGVCCLPACRRACMCSVFVRFGSVRRSARNALAIGERSIEHVCVLVYGSMSNQNKHKNPNKPKRRTHEDTYALRIK